jgi:hypothetical protein
MLILLIYLEKENLNTVKRITQLLLGTSKYVGEKVNAENFSYVHILAPDCRADSE